MPRQKRRNQPRVQQVAVVDPLAMNDGAKIDRMIAEVNRQESQVRLVIGDAFQLNASSAAAGGVYDYGNISASDDFATMSQQFSEFRITAIKFQIIDLATSSNVTNIWSSFHAEYTARPTYAFADVADGPDAQVVPPGSGMITLYWKAHGSLEQQFQNSVSGGTSPTVFGGFRWSFGTSPTTVSPKWLVNVKAVVDFRGRY